MGSQSGGRKELLSAYLLSASASPNSSHTPLPASIPRIKLNIRSLTPTPPTTAPRTKSSQPRTNQSLQRNPRRKTRVSTSNLDSGSDSSLTPQGDDDDEDDDEIEVTSRRKSLGNRPKSSEKGKERAKVDTRLSDKKNVGNLKRYGKKEDSPTRKVTVSGPAGRERRKAIKIEEAGRRRARDMKFDVSDDVFGSSSGGMLRNRSREYDDASSYGDDESDQAMSQVTFTGFDGGLGHDSEDDETRGLPEAFAGQEIEDLAYGAGRPEIELEREAMDGFWQDEDEEMFISHLSGSEIDQQSQSSVHSPPPSYLESSTSASEGEDEEEVMRPEDQVDEFGFPIIPSSTILPGEEGGDGDAPPLVLMENWDGQFVLVQPRAERSRSSKRNGSRGSRTHAPSSIADSNFIAGDGEMSLMIDPEAYNSDGFISDETSEWSGESDDNENDGDTTDSMDEDDMPMLDSPAMQELIDQQIGTGTLGNNQPLPSAENLGALNDGGPIAPSSLPLVVSGGAPSIIVTDTTSTIPPQTPGLSSTTSSNTPTLNGNTEVNGTGVPSTPSNIPIMGTFIPTSDDPAQHAVIDGSKSSTKSPFTHRRRSKRGRNGSMTASVISSTMTGTTGGMPTPSMKSGFMSSINGNNNVDGINGINGEKKRKSRSSSMITSDYPFNYTNSAIESIDNYENTNSLTRLQRKKEQIAKKKARYTSIPGHPKYLAAQRKAFAEEEGEYEEDDGEITESSNGGRLDDIDEMDLEDMLDERILSHYSKHSNNSNSGSAGAGLGDNGRGYSIRFDRVPMSNYLKRNFGNGHHLNGHSNSMSIGGGAGGGAGAGLGHSFSNIHTMNGMDMRYITNNGGGGRGKEGKEGMVNGHGEKMLISPLLGPIGDREGRSRGRRPVGIKI